MDDKQYYTDLAQERDRILDELAKENPHLSGELKVVLRLMDKFNKNNISGTLKNTVETKESSFVLPSEKPVGHSIKVKRIVKPTQLIKKVFAENPNKTFSPPEIRDLILKFIEDGLTYVKGRKLLVTSHTILKGLVNQNYIDKIIENEGADPTYKLRQKEKGLLDTNDNE